MSWIGRETSFIERLPFFPEMTVYLIGSEDKSHSRLL